MEGGFGGGVSDGSMVMGGFLKWVFLVRVEGGFLVLVGGIVEGGFYGNVIRASEGFDLVLYRGKAGVFVGMSSPGI